MPKKYLIADEFGTHIGKHSQRLRLTRSKTREKLGDYPLLHLEAVLVLSQGVSVSADAVQACSERGIPLFFIAGTGRVYALLYSAALVGTVSTRRAQIRAYDDERGVAVAIAMAQGKLRNQRAALRYFAKNAEAVRADAVQIAAQHVQDGIVELDRLPRTASLDEIRNILLGIEGRAATHYWEGVRAILRPTFDWPGRRTRGANDVFNQALNYGYGVLYGQVERALLLAGLDPYAGFLHADRPGKPSLVLDLIEEFRQQVVDRPLIGYVNKGGHLEQDEGGLAKPTRRKIAELVLDRLTTRMPFEGERLSLNTILQTQARHLAMFLRGERDAYEPFVGTW